MFHRKKSMGLRSGDLSGHACGPPHPIHCSKKLVYKRPGHPQRSVKEFHCEDTTFVGMFVDQYSPIARVVHLAENADRMHL
jgi:hypothetical protein